MNDGEVDKMLHVFGSKFKDILNQFTKFKKNRFYLDPKLVGDCYLEFIIIDASEIEVENFNQWIDGKVQSEFVCSFIVDDKQYLSGESLIAYPLKLGDIFPEPFVFKNHEELVSVLEALSELQNRFSLMDVDFADFYWFLRRGEYFWSDIIYSHSIDELRLEIVEKLENVKARAKDSGLKVSALFGCLIGNISSFESNVCKEYELIGSTLREHEPLFECGSETLIIHTNVEMYEEIDIHHDSKIGFHMLWSLSES